MEKSKRKRKVKVIKDEPPWYENEAQKVLEVRGGCSFLIGYDGRVYEGRGWGVAPRLPKPYTKRARTSIHICFIANADCDCDLQMYDAKFDLVEWGERFGYINPDYMIFEPRRDYLNEGNEVFLCEAFEYDP